MQHQALSPVCQQAERLRFFFFLFLKWNYRTSKTKTACQTGPLHLELSLVPRWKLGDSGIFSGNQAGETAWCEAVWKTSEEGESLLSQLCLKRQVEPLSHGQKRNTKARGCCDDVMRARI